MSADLPTEKRLHKKHRKLQKLFSAVVVSETDDSSATDQKGKSFFDLLAEKRELDESCFRRDYIQQKFEKFHKKDASLIRSRDALDAWVSPILELYKKEFEQMIEEKAFQYYGSGDTAWAILRLPERQNLPLAIVPIWNACDSLSSRLTAAYHGTYGAVFNVSHEPVDDDEYEDPALMERHNTTTDALRIRVIIG
jgi:hypothetical protein